MSVTAPGTVLKTAQSATATGLWSMVIVNATRLILESAARLKAMPSPIKTKSGAAPGRTSQFAAAGALVWRASVSATKGKIQRRRTVDDIASAAILTVHTSTTGTVLLMRMKNIHFYSVGSFYDNSL